MLYRIDDRTKETLDLRDREAFSHPRPRRHCRGLGPKGYTRPDERISEDVCEALTEAADVDPSLVEVHVRDGNVTLHGVVRSAHEQWRAQDIVESCAGVRHVTNDIRVRRP